MKKNQYAIVLSFTAAICFLISYLYNKEKVTLILSCAWFAIAIANYKKNNKK